MRALAWRALVLLTLGLFGAQLLSGCGASQRQKALSTALAGVDGARDGFVTWDDAHQQELVLTAKSYEEGVLRINAYRSRREVVLAAFEAAYQALATAAIDKDKLSLDEALARVSLLYTALKELMGEIREPAKPAPASGS